MYKRWQTVWILLICVLLQCVPALASAQESRLRMDVRAGSRVGLGAWGDFGGPGIGGALGLYLSPLRPLMLGVSVGYYRGLWGEYSGGVVNALATMWLRSEEAPILFDARFYLLGDPDHFGLWIEASAGLTHFVLTRQLLGEPLREAELFASAAVGLGFDLGLVDLRGQMLWISRPDTEQYEIDDPLGLLLTVGIDIDVL